MTTSCPAWIEPAGVVQADDRRHFERSREDRGVIGPAAGVGREAADLRPVDLRGERRRQLVGDEHRRLVELAQQIARRRHALPQVHPQPADQVGDVALALAQVGVGHLVEDRAELVERPAARAHSALTRCSRTSSAARGTSIGSSSISSCASNSAASSGPRRRATRARMSTQLLARSRAALLEPRQLVLDARRRDLVAQHLRALDQDDRPARRRCPATRRCRSGVACVLAEAGLDERRQRVDRRLLVGAVGRDRDGRCRAPPPAAGCP